MEESGEMEEINGDEKRGGRTAEDKMETDEREIESIRLRSRILDQVAASNGFFKSQQRGERDLGFEEKRDIAGEILDRDVCLFLQRYRDFVAPEDLAEYFAPYRHTYEVAFYLDEARKRHDRKKSGLRIKNRRYGALQRFVKEGKYFSDEEMRTRNPLLYEQMVGRFLTDKEKQEMRDKELSEMTFSGFLMTQMNKAQDSYAEERQRDEEDETWEEEEESSSSDDDDGGAASVVTEPEKRRLKSEFVNIMYESFLSGKDRDFDYSTVDDNTEYDPVDVEQRDEEEKYFDSEEPGCPDAYGSTEDDT